MAAIPSRGLEVSRTFVDRGVLPGRWLSVGRQGLCWREAGRHSALDALAVLPQLKERRVSLHMIDMGGDVTGNGISKLVFTILSAVAGMGVIASRERVATVKSVQKQRGRYLCGKVRFG